MSEKLKGYALKAAGVAALLLPFGASATTTDLTAFNAALDQGAHAGSSMIGGFGEKGVILTVAAIAAAVVIVLIVVGAKKGAKAMQGKFGKK